MRRRLFNLAATVSLVLFVCTVIAGALSYARQYRVRWSGNRGNPPSRSVHRTVGVGNGEIFFGLGYAEWPYNGSALSFLTRPANPHETDWMKPYARGWWPGIARYVVLDDYTAPRAVSYHLYINCFPIAALLLLLPAVSFLRRRRSGDPHSCSTCGYDLRATPDRCPECGTEPNPQPAQGVPT